MLQSLNTQVSSKGQVIIPKLFRDEHHWHAGTKLTAFNTPEGILLKPLQTEKKISIREAVAQINARTHYSGPHVSVEEMNFAIGREAVKRFERTRRQNKSSSGI